MVVGGFIILNKERISLGQVVFGLFLSLVLGACAYMWYEILCKRPLEVKWAGEDSLVFRCLIGNTKIAVRDIISINNYPYIKNSSWIKWPPFIKFQYSQGTINLLGPLTGFANLLDRVLVINPAVELILFPYQ
jgi:hypothetical protein